MTGRRAAPFWLALVVLLLTSGTAFVVGAALREERQSSTRQAAAEQQAAIAATHERAADLAARLAPLDDVAARRAVGDLAVTGGVGAEAASTRGEVVAAGVATRSTPSGSLVLQTPLRIGPLFEGGSELDPRLARLLPLAIDRPTVVSGPFTARGDRLAVGIAASFGPGVDGTVLPVGQRRAASTGFAFVVLNLDVDPPAAARLTGPDGDEARWPGAGTPGDLFAGSIQLRGRNWRWEVGRPATPTTLPLAIAFGGTPLAIAAALALRRLLRRIAGAERQAAERGQQLRSVEDASTQLQRSLDLAEILPGFAVEIGDDFGLAAVSVSVTNDDGELLETFRTGRDNGSSPVETDGGLRAGRVAELPLRRGWRTVGSLRIQAGRDLDEVEVSALHALAELLAIALTNAQLFQRERDAANQLRELDTLKNAFLGTVSHELRTPTAAITGFADLLDQHWDDLEEDRRRDLARRIGRNAGSLRHLIDALLDFARLEQERMVITPREISLSEVVTQATDQMQPLLPDHQLDVRAVSGVLAWADPFAVERVLANLLSNAGKYTPAGTKVTVEVLPAGDRARLVVADQGPGISPEERQHIFTRFYRGTGDATLRTRGAGIGLAILADFAAASGAEVRVDDAPGGGARFVVDFPVRPTGQGFGDGSGVAT